MTKTPVKTDSAAERERERSQRIKKEVAALRPKISKAEAMRRRAKSMRRFMLFEIISGAVVTCALIYLGFQFFEANKPEAENEAVFQVMLWFWGLVTLHSAIIIRTSVVRLNHDNLISEDTTDHFFRGWRLTPFIPVIGLIIMTPAILSGMFNGDDIGTVGNFFMMLMLLFVASLLGPLVAAFIIAPIELIIRGVIALIKGDKTRIGYVIVGGVIASLTVFIALGSMAVSAGMPYPAGSVQIVLALLGIPGDYRVNSEGLLWLTRLLLLGLVIFFIAIRAQGKRRTQ